MAARLAALASKAKSAAEPLWTRARTEAVKNYDSLMASNAQYVVKDKEVADKLFKQLVFTNLAKIPLTVQACQAESAAVRSQLRTWRDLPATELATYGGFAAELYAWFCIGEIIGRGGSLTGYNV
ncbi:hydrogen-transporting ATP rotational mechanism [Micractinium conductrix]|uniref:Hydrogen-transporting ATP rotational mechanism n=1 Tax=Micractinium conductrix TaxID=554055 RepID=A0A2P6VI17_9CHLO|nr:hydrogen-transporting ATP rotational mechanism [Micractinium conductrix]|eukprot:PSC73707.1 hydrogen-transporting ATP rotational mechanism [Micractinium conductrix]